MTHPLYSGLSPATVFLLERVCCPRADAPPKGPPPPPADIAAEARRQLIAGVLHAWAQREPDSPWRSALLTELQGDAESRAIGALELVRETLKAVAVLQHHGIDALVLKGPLLSKRYYGDYGTRHAGDVDLLVDEAAATQADQRLQEAGYVRIKPRKPLHGRRLQLYFDTQHEFGYTAPSGAAVELHWRVADCRQLWAEPFAKLWERSEVVDAAGAPLHILGPADTFTQLAVHGYTDGWSRLKWIADLPRVMSALSGDPELQGGGLSRINHLASVLAGLPGDADWLVPVFAYIRSRLTSQHPRTQPLMARARHATAARRFTRALLTTAELRRESAFCNLIMPADFDRLPLPQALTPLLPYLAKPQRALGLRKSASG